MESQSDDTHRSSPEPGERPEGPRPREIVLDDEAIEILEDAVRVLRELDEIRPADMTALFFAMQYENLSLTLRDVLGVIGFLPRLPPLFDE